MPSLDYATTGPGLLYTTIGWFDFSSIPDFSTPGQVFTLTNDMIGGGKITATFTLSSTNPSMTFTPQVPPTWGGAAFGKTAYLGLTQKVCLRSGGTGTGTINVTGIDIRDRFNAPITNYNFYFTDSETPGGGQTETFTTNGSGWQQFYQMPDSGSGFATLTGLGTTVVNATGLGNVPILLTKSPSDISQTVLGAGAMSFGISITLAELFKVVTGRLDSSDQFKLDIAGPNSGTTITVGSNLGLQQQFVQVTTGVDGVFTFDESMASGSVSPLSFYNPTVQLSNKASGGTTLPSTITLGTPITLVNGDYAVMTITNAPASTQVNINKNVNKQYSGISEALTYTITIANASPYSVTNLVMRDTIPSNTTFITDTLTLNGVTQNGVSPAPPTGFNVGTLGPNEMATITFQVLVDNTIPNPNRVINSATATYSPTINFSSSVSQNVLTTINGVVINATKSVNKSYAQVGDTIAYSIVLKNTGNVTASNIIFVDTIPNNTTLIAGTFNQDSTPLSGSPNPPGITLPNGLGPNKTTTITFQVKANTFPTPNPIQNSADISYDFTIDPSAPNSEKGSNNTNIVYTAINGATLSGITKSVDKTYATCGDLLNYTIVVPNSGNVTAFNVVIKDTIPNGTQFVTDSVFINGSQSIGSNPNTGVTLPNIAPGTTTTITFSVKVQC